MADQLQRRRCAGTNRKGEPCNAAPLRDGDHCSAHNQDATPAARFGSSEWSRTFGPLGGRPRVERPTEIAQRLLEARVADALHQAGLMPVLGELGEGQPGALAPDRSLR